MSDWLSKEDTNHMNHCEFLINVNQYLNAGCRLAWKYRNSGNCKHKRKSPQFAGSSPLTSLSYHEKYCGQDKNILSLVKYILSYGEDLGKRNSSCHWEKLKSCLDTSFLTPQRRKFIISWGKDTELCHILTTDKYLSKLEKVNKQTKKIPLSLGKMQENILRPYH